MVNLFPSIRSHAALAEVSMPNGTPVTRDWVYVLQDGTVVIEWEEGTLQDIQTGDFLHQGAFGHPVQDTELEQLRLTGRVEKFDARTVYLRALPDFKRNTIE
jgi:hypothetical protein